LEAEWSYFKVNVRHWNKEI